MPGHLPVEITEFDTAIGRCAVAWRGTAVTRFRLPGFEPLDSAAPSHP